MANLDPTLGAATVNIVDDVSGVSAGVTADFRLKVDALVSTSPALTDQTGSGTISAVSQTVVITPSGRNGLGVSITGTWVGTLQLEFNNGDGVWYADDWVDHANGTAISSISTNSGLFAVVGGHAQVRLRASAWTSGTATVTWNLSVESGYSEVFQVDPREMKVSDHGEVTTSAPSYTNGSVKPLSLDTAGNLRVSPSSAAALNPGTVGAGESSNNRAYQTTYEITLGNSGVEGNIILLRNPTGSGKKAYIRGITFSNTQGAAKSTIARVYQNPTLSTAAVTFTGAGDLVNLTAHGYINGDLVSFATIVTTTGIVINTNYYVVGATANTFQVSLTSGGSAINLVTNGTGTIYRAGASLAPVSMNIGGGAPTSAIVVTVIPLTSSLGTKLSVAAQTNEQATLDYDWGLILNAGQSLLITGTGTANNVPMVVNVIWSDAT